ncbi:MAG: UbiA family prenyltransferase [archaeon]
MLLSLLRAKQWYKNLVIFLPIIFAEAIFIEGHLQMVLFGFLSLCFVSSASYIINDIVDAKEDRWHIEKCKRPIAAGKIGVGAALVIALMLFVGSIFIASKLSYNFALCVLALFLLTQVYIFFLKKEMFADVATISTNFVIRAVSGAVLLSVRVSPWLILCTFFLSMFLVATKRKGDLGLVKNKYTPEITDRLMTFSTVALVMSYSLYSFLSLYPLLIVTLPFAIYVVFSYSYLTDKNRVLARNPEKAFKEPKIVIGSLFWIALAFIVIYLKPLAWIF